MGKGRETSEEGRLEHLKIRFREGETIFDKIFLEFRIPLLFVRSASLTELIEGNVLDSFL